MAKKSNGVMTADCYKPDSNLSLEGEHAKAMQGAKMGKKVKMTIHGTKQRHSMNHDGSHSISIKIHKVEGLNDKV